MQLQIASRVIAVFVVSFALAVVFVRFERAEREAIEQFDSREDLIAYMRSDDVELYWACYFLSVFAGLAYIAVVETVALVVRYLADRIKPQQPSK